VVIHSADFKHTSDRILKGKAFLHGEEKVAGLLQRGQEIGNSAFRIGWEEGGGGLLKSP